MNAEISTTKKLPEFSKRTVAVLTEPEMMEVNGGTTTVCLTALYSSEPCATGVAAASLVLYKIVVG